MQATVSYSIDPNDRMEASEYENTSDSDVWYHSYRSD